MSDRDGNVLKKLSMPGCPGCSNFYRGCPDCSNCYSYCESPECGSYSDCESPECGSCTCCESPECVDRSVCAAALSLLAVPCQLAAPYMMGSVKALGEAVRILLTTFFAALNFTYEKYYEEPQKTKQICLCMQGCVMILYILAVFSASSDAVTELLPYVIWLFMTTIFCFPALQKFSKTANMTGLPEMWEDSEMENSDFSDAGEHSNDFANESKTANMTGLPEMWEDSDLENSDSSDAGEHSNEREDIFANESKTANITGLPEMREDSDLEKSDSSDAGEHSNDREGIFANSCIAILSRLATLAPTVALVVKTFELNEEHNSKMLFAGLCIVFFIVFEVFKNLQNQDLPLDFSKKLLENLEHKRVQLASWTIVQFCAALGMLALIDWDGKKSLSYMHVAEVAVTCVLLVSDIWIPAARSWMQNRDAWTVYHSVIIFVFMHIPSLLGVLAVMDLDFKFDLLELNMQHIVFQLAFVFFASLGKLMWTLYGLHIILVPSPPEQWKITVLSGKGHDDESVGAANAEKVQLGLFIAPIRQVLYTGVFVVWKMVQTVKYAFVLLFDYVHNYMSFQIGAYLPLCTFRFHGFEKTWANWEQEAENDDLKMLEVQVSEKRTMISKIFAMNIFLFLLTPCVFFFTAYNGEYRSETIVLLDLAIVVLLVPASGFRSLLSVCKSMKAMTARTLGELLMYLAIIVIIRPIAVLIASGDANMIFVGFVLALYFQVISTSLTPFLWRIHHESVRDLHYKQWIFQNNDAFVNVILFLYSAHYFGEVDDVSYGCLIVMMLLQTLSGARLEYCETTVNVYRHVAEWTAVLALFGGISSLNLILPLLTVMAKTEMNAIACILCGVKSLLVGRGAQLSYIWFSNAASHVSDYVDPEMGYLENAWMGKVESHEHHEIADSHELPHELSNSYGLPLEVYDMSDSDDYEHPHAMMIFDDDDVAFE